MTNADPTPADDVGDVTAVIDPPLRGDAAAVEASVSVDVGVDVDSAVTGETVAPALARERRHSGPSLGRGLAIASVVAAVLPAAGLLWTLLSSPAAPAADGPLPPVSAAPASSAATVANLVALKAAVDDLSVQARAAADTVASLTARTDAADRGERLRVIQRQVARARDARRAAGQTGPALRGPFPVDELGDVSALALGNQRWLIGRDGSVLAPVRRTAPVALATTGRDEDAASFAAAVDGVTVTLLRQCVPLEPYCLVDVVAAGPAGRPAIDTGRLALAVAGLEADVRPNAVPADTAPVTAAPSSSQAPPPWLLLMLAGLGVAVSVGVAHRLLRLSSDVKRSTWRLQAGLAGRAPAAPSGLTAELTALETAIDDVVATMEAHGTRVAERQHQCARLEGAVVVLDQARDRGGVERLSPDAADDAVTARLALAVDQLLDALDERARRFKLGIDEVDGTGRLLSPLAQRLLRVARLPDVPQTAADELTSLGNALGQRSRKANALGSLLEELSRLQPGSRNAITDAAALRTLPHTDASRLAAAENADRDADENSI